MKKKELGKEDNFPTKELNLGELLKGCEGERFFSPTHGAVILEAMDDYYLRFRVSYRGTASVPPKISLKTGYADYYPSEELFVKYPLDAPKAWQEWKKARKPEQWHPKNGEGFWCISPNLRPYYNEESDPEFDWRLDLNHFKTKDTCQQAIEVVRKVLKKFHEKNTEKE